MAKIWVDLSILIEVPDNILGKEYDGDAWEWVGDNLITGVEENSGGKITEEWIEEVDSDY